jgi:hypothetical protein
MLPRARTVSEVPNGDNERSLDRPSYWKTSIHAHPDTMTCSHQILASATIPLSHRHALLIVAAVRLLSALRAGRRQAAAIARTGPSPAFADRFYHGSLGQRHRLHEPSKTLEIMKGLQRQTWQHGCADPHLCGARYHKTKPCPKNCKRHQRACPGHVPHRVLRVAPATLAGVLTVVAAVWSRSRSSPGLAAAVSPFPTSSSS